MKKLLGKRIKELRTRKGLTQEQLAEEVGIGERNLSKIECGINFVSADTLERLSDALNVTPKDLFDFDYPQTKSARKEELLNAISHEKIDIELLYKIYCSIRK